MDAPRNWNCYNGWTKVLSKAVGKWVRQNKTNRADTVPERIVCFTDGSKQGNKAGFAVWYPMEPEEGVIRRTEGDQEINNAELQAALEAMSGRGRNNFLEVYSDSLNTCRFLEDGWKVPGRKIRNQTNARTKLAIKARMEERQIQGIQMKVHHVRSHAEETRLADHKKRKADNNRRFGTRTGIVQEANKMADIGAGNAVQLGEESAPWIQPDDFTYQVSGKRIDGNSRRQIKEIKYNILRRDWKKRQPVRSQFIDDSVWAQSLPDRKTSWANLWQKIMTGTIWTNKLRNRLNKEISPNCPRCSERSATPIIDSHEHVLGECPLTLDYHDDMWKSIKAVWKRHGLNTDGIEPWFAVNEHFPYRWSMPKQLGNKGLLPMELRERLRRKNRGRNLDQPLLHTKIIVRHAKIKGFMDRWALVYEDQPPNLSRG